MVSGTGARMPQQARHESASTVLPAWSSVLAVVAHPDDESFGLGAVLDAARSVRADGLLVFDASGVTGHPDHAAATDAALLAAVGLDMPVLGWTLPAAVAEALNRELG